MLGGHLLAAAAAAVSVGHLRNMRDAVEAAAAVVDTHVATVELPPSHMLCSLAEEQRWETHTEPSRQQWKQQIAHQHGRR